ncbi:MAG: iron ABC transporter permease, partial [Syntrophales bacterium]
MAGKILRRYDLTAQRLLFLALLTSFALAFLFYPLGFTLTKAFWVADPAGGSRFTVAVFLLMFTDPANWELILNSINLALAVTLLTTLLAVPMAWVMNRFAFPLKGLMTGLLLVPLVLPPFVGAVGMKQMFARFGSFNLLLL